MKNNSLLILHLFILIGCLNSGVQKTKYKQKSPLIEHKEIRKTYNLENLIVSNLCDSVSFTFTSNKLKLDYLEKNEGFEFETKEVFFDKENRKFIFLTNSNELVILNLCKPSYQLKFKLDSNNVLIQSYLLSNKKYNRYFVELKKNKNIELFEIEEDMEILEYVEGTPNDFPVNKLSKLIKT